MSFPVRCSEASNTTVDLCPPFGRRSGTIASPLRHSVSQAALSRYESHSRPGHMGSHLVTAGFFLADSFGLSYAYSMFSRKAKAIFIPRTRTEGDLESISPSLTDGHTLRAGPGRHRRYAESRQGRGSSASPR